MNTLNSDVLIVIFRQVGHVEFLILEKSSRWLIIQEAIQDIETIKEACFRILSDYLNISGIISLTDTEKKFPALNFNEQSIIVTLTIAEITKEQKISLKNPYINFRWLDYQSTLALLSSDRDKEALS